MKNFITKRSILLVQPPSISTEFNRNIIIMIYLALGCTFIITGGYTILENPYVCLPVQVDYNGDNIIYLVRILQGMLHLFIDLSITQLFIGNMLLWAALNFSKSKIIDLLLVVFFSMSTFIHWNESFDKNRTVNSFYIGLIPLTLIIIVTLLKRPENNDYNN